MPKPTRREFLAGTTTLALLAAGSGPARAADAPAPTGNATAGPAGTPQGAGDAPAWSAQHQPVPLPFDPAKLNGISEKLIRSHHENNYTGAVKALNAVRGRLLQAVADTASAPYLYSGLKREQLARTGSVVYHELYFGNLGGNGQADAATRGTLARAFGSFDAWETEFRRMAGGLAGGSGWVVLAWNPLLKLLENQSFGDHGGGVSGSRPVLVMDMYEHSYQMDYGAAAAKYIDAFMANVHWEAVAARLAAASA